MDTRHRKGVGTRPGSAALARVCALALATGLLAGCGDDGGPDAGPGAGSETASQGADRDLGYGAPAPGSADSPSGTTSGGEQAAEEIVIVIEDFSYELPDSVPSGAEIVVRNLDGVGHTVTADEGDTFDVVVGPGEEVSFTAPSEAGEYPFHCTPHPAMTSTLVVEGDGS